MKKLICYFVLISSFLCGVGGASSYKSQSNSNKTIMKGREWALRVGPVNAVNSLFEQGFKDRDFKDVNRAITVPNTIADMYPNRRDLQLLAIDAWAQNMRNQTVNGKRKYSDNDIRAVVLYSKKILNL